MRVLAAALRCGHTKWRKVDWMPTTPTKAELQAELNARDRDKLSADLSRAIEDVDEMERLLTKAEDAVGRPPHWSDQDPLTERLRRVGVRRAAIERIRAMFDVLAGKSLSAELRAMLDQTDAAEESAIAQLSAIVAAHRG